MHWLPLVAMVIASALPFPHSPASRIAAAMTETGANGDRSKEDRRDSSGRLTAPTQHHADYNASHKDYNMATTPGRDAAAQTHLTAGKEGFTHADLRAVLSSSQGESHKGSYRTDSDSANSVNDVNFDGTMEKGLGTSKCNIDNVSKHVSIPRDYNPSGGGGEQDGVRVGDLAPVHALRSPPQSGREGIGVGQATRAPLLGASSSSVQDQRGPEASVQPKDTTGTGRFPAHGEEGKMEAEGGLGQTQEGLGLGTGLVVDADTLQEGNDLFLDQHPRVLFSPSPSPPEHPPLLLILETGVLRGEEAGEEEEREDGYRDGHGDRATPGRRPGPGRSKRSHPSEVRRGERSVCESESVWVTDKKTATDSHGRTVSILPEIQTQTGPLKQYFYETRCRRAEQPRGAGPAAGGATGVAGASCLGVDRKQWVSECKAKQSFVRALTKDANNRTGWRWIRIDSSCVCVLLSRVNRQWGGERV